MVHIDIDEFLVNANSYRSRLPVIAERLTAGILWLSDAGSALTASLGDWLLTDGESIWTVAADVFPETYRAMGDGRYVKTALVTARQLDHADEFMTLEGEALAAAGDWLVRNPSGEVWPVSDDEFARRYERAMP